MKTILLFFLRLLYRFRAENLAVLQTPGPVMLLPNHVSWFDWLFVAVCLDKDWRFVTSKEGAEVSWGHRLVMINRFTFPVETDSPYAIKRVAQYLQTGGKLVIFPEGRLSRTGSLMKLFEGTGARCARQKLTRWLYDMMVRQQFDLEMAACPANIPAAIVETARRCPSAVALQDATRAKLSYRRLLAASAALAARW